MRAKPNAVKRASGGLTPFRSPERDHAVAIALLGELQQPQRPAAERAGASPFARTTSAVERHDRGIEVARHRPESAPTKGRERTRLDGPELGTLQPEPLEEIERILARHLDERAAERPVTNETHPPRGLRCLSHWGTACGARSREPVARLDITEHWPRAQPRPIARAVRPIRATMSSTGQRAQKETPQMQRRGDPLIFSPSDITRFFESPFASWMDRYRIERPGTVTPGAAGAEMTLLAAMGIAHEKRHVASLRAAGSDVWEPPSELGDFETRHRATLEAMRAGRDVIYQGALGHGDFAGYSDFLHRVARPSKLGAFSYEVSDTKLARNSKPYFLLQLCAYAKMLEHLQGVRPESVAIVNGAGERVAFRTDDYFFYFASLEEQFLEAQRSFDPDQQPIPEARADHGRWQTHADAILDRMDHPSRVAGISSHQVRRLADAGITTLTSLAASPARRIPKMDDVVFERLRAQARLQHASVGTAAPLYEIVVPVGEIARIGLAMVPPVSPGDVYFDMEGFPLTEGGLEYLFGATYIENGRPLFKDFWAHDRAGEKRAFEEFLDWVYARFTADPSMHVFHYAAYEVSALRRLMGAHCTRERELDALLTAEVFVDLYRVVKQAIRVGAPSYSLKKVELLYRPAREGDVATAAQSVVEYARWLETQDGKDWESSPRGARWVRRQVSGAGSGGGDRLDVRELGGEHAAGDRVFAESESVECGAVAGGEFGDRGWEPAAGADAGEQRGADEVGEFVLSGGGGGERVRVGSDPRRRLLCRGTTRAAHQGIGGESNPATSSADRSFSAR